MHHLHVSAIVVTSMNIKRPAIPENQFFLILFSIVLLLIVGSLAFLHHQKNNIPATQMEHLSLERQVIASFAGSEDTSADAPSLNRLLRGKVIAIDDKQQTMTFAAYVNFPELAVTRDISLTLTPRTQFLCWTKLYRTETGAEIDIEKAGYLLGENEKLFLQGEKRITLTEANTILSKQFETNPITGERRTALSALVALETSYSLNRENRVFQIALLGCDEK